MLGRRRVLLAIVAVSLLAACTRDASPRRETTASAGATTTTTATSSTTTAETATANTRSDASVSPSVSTQSSASSAPEPLAPATLQGAVDGFVARQSVPFSVVAVDLATGESAEHLADRSVLSASLYKLFVARELLRRIDDGEIRSTDPMGDSQGRTVEQCIVAMIEVSDNPCGEAGLERVGYGAADASIHAAGYGSTSLATPQRTTARDIALFFERTRDGTVVGAGHEGASAELYSLLAQQQVNDRLPAGLPPGTPIAHKTGDRYYWAHDAGVFTTGEGDVVLVVLSGPWPYPCCDAAAPGPLEARAFGAIAQLATVVYDQVTR